MKKRSPYKTRVFAKLESLPQQHLEFFLRFSLLLITNITSSCIDATESKANSHVENNGSYNSDNTPKEGMHTPLKGIGQVSSFVCTVRHHYKKKKKNDFKIIFIF